MVARLAPLIAAAVWAGQAAAHAGLVASIPADGAALGAPPSSIELRFTEPVQPLEARLLDASGARISLAAPQVDGEVVRLALPQGLKDGRYLLSFRVASADSHPVGGSIVFAIGEGAPPPRAAGGVRREALSAAKVMVRAARDLALLVAAGGALFLLALGRFPADRPLLALSGGLAALAALPAAALHDVPLSSSFGLSMALGAAGALAVGAAALMPPRRTRTMLLATGAIAAIASFPLTGHALTSAAGVFAAAALAAHGLAAAFWAGSLAALLAIVIRQPAGEAALALRRFSRLGVVAVAVLFAAGAAFALLQIETLPALAGSSYGRLILAKAALLAILVALALVNRLRFLPLLERGALAAAGRLRWSIAGEVALIACVIALTAALVQTPPPRASGGGFSQRLVQLGYVAEFSVTPARAGSNLIALRFIDAEGLPLDPDELLIQIGNPAAGVEPATRPLRRAGPGRYLREGIDFSFAGTWDVEVLARLDGEILVFRAQVPVH